MLVFSSLTMCLNSKNDFKYLYYHILPEEDSKYSLPTDRAAWQLSIQLHHKRAQQFFNLQMSSENLYKMHEKYY